MEFSLRITQQAAVHQVSLPEVFLGSKLTTLLDLFGLLGFNEILWIESIVCFTLNQTYKMNVCRT